MVEIVRRYSNRGDLLRLTERLTKALQGAGPAGLVESMSAPPAHRVELRLSLEARAALAADYEAGATIADLCARYGLARGSVSRLLHGAQTPVRGRPMDSAAVHAAVHIPPPPPGEHTSRDRQRRGDVGALPRTRCAKPAVQRTDETVRFPCRAPIPRYRPSRDRHEPRTRRPSWRP